MRAICLTVLGLLASVSSALVRSYSVEPQTAAQSGWTRTIPGQDTVSQVLTINFDELVYCEFFNGKGSAAGIDVNVFTYPGGNLVASGDTNDHGDHKWLRCYLNTSAPESIVKGKQLEFRFSRGGSDSTQFYWSEDPNSPSGQGPYLYGHMIVGGQNQTTRDLACRVMGQMNAVDSTYWSVDAFAFPWGEPQWYRDTWAVRAQEANLKAVRLSIEWKEFEKDPDSFDFGMLDDALQCIVNSAHCQVLGCLVSCPPWASTRTVIDSFSNPDTFVTPHAPPQNLFEPVSSDYNYYARYLRALLPHCDSVHTWEISNEQNDSGPHCSDPLNYVEGWFHRPDRSFYPGVDTGLLGLCQLYMRLAAVTESVIRHDGFPGHENDRVLLGGVFGATDSAPHLTPGWKWLDLCYEIAGNNVFWDGVAVHPYQSHNGLDPVLFEREAETLRAVMRQHGHAGAELWNT
jgi:hypothetical protein